MSIAGHLLILLALLSPRAPLPKRIDAVPVTVAMVDVQRVVLDPAPAPAPAPASSAPPSPALPSPPRNVVTRSPAPSEVDPAPEGSGSELSEAQLAGAASAGSGAAAGACDMAGRVQSALRKDPLVQAAVAGSPGKATMVWNGDWVRSRGEDGKGLAAVREAIMWEVAFAPQACRAKPVRGLILISLNGAAGSVRLAVGATEWRWSDLLTPRPAEP